MKSKNVPLFCSNCKKKKRTHEKCANCGKKLNMRIVCVRLGKISKHFCSKRCANHIISSATFIPKKPSVGIYGKKSLLAPAEAKPPVRNPVPPPPISPPRR